MTLILLVSERLSAFWTREEVNAMRHHNSVFHQLTKLIPWDVFEASVIEYEADKGVRRLRTRDQFLSLLYGQFSEAVSLRGIEDGLKSCRHRLYHLGARPVARTTLADANQKRSYKVYRNVFAELVRRSQPGLRRKLGHAVRLIDATKVTLPSRSAEWSRQIKNHCAAKVHVVYDPIAAMPLEAVVTSQNVNDITPARALVIEPGATYVFDLGYYSYEWWDQLEQLGSRFVTRLKTNTELRDTVDLPVQLDSHILADRIGHLSKHIMKGKNPYTDPVREIVVRRDDGKCLRLVTNDLDASAEEIADLYKQRWEIELFFKWIKQNLKIRHFIGTSENAVKTQIYIALIAFLLLRAAHNLQKMVQRPQAFARLVKLNLMTRRCLSQLLKPTRIDQKDKRQKSLCFDTI